MRASPFIPQHAALTVTDAQLYNAYTRVSLQLHEYSAAQSSQSIHQVNCDVCTTIRVLNVNITFNS